MKGYYIKDHLGNICAVVNSETNTPVQRTVQVHRQGAGCRNGV